MAVRPGEGRRTALLFAHLLLASAVFILGRTVRDTLFLSRYPLSALPWMFVLYGVASAVTVVVYALVADRIPRHRMIIISLAVGAVTYLGTWVLVRFGFSWIYPTFYVWSEVAANLFIVQFWTFSNDLHDPRAARRLVPVIGSARVLGVVVIGLVAGIVVRAIGTEQLLFVLVAMMGAIALIARRLGREPLPERPRRPTRRRGRAPRIVGHPYVRALAVTTLLAFTALTIGDYQFKAIAKATYQEDDLATYFSLFYAGTGLLSFLFQILVTPRLLRRFGVGMGMSVMPSVFGVASLALPLVPHLGVATVMKFADNGFQYTIHETTLQALYAPFADAVKARTRAFLGAVVKPLSYGLGGVVLVLLSQRMPVEMLSIVTGVVVIAWLAMVPVVRRRYLRTLEATLSARGSLALETRLAVDSEGRAALIRTLRSDDPRTAIAALEQLDEDDSDEVRAAIIALAEGATGRLRAKALRRLERFPDASVASVRPALSDPDPRVRATAVIALARIGGDDEVEDIAGHLDDEDEGVRVAALAALMDESGVEGSMRGAPLLQQKLRSADRGDRIESTEVLALLQKGTHRPLARLMTDPDPTVRRAALRAAGKSPDPRFTDILVHALSEPGLRKRAGAALVAIGPPAIDPLVALLDDTTTARRVRLEIPRLLRAIPSEVGYQRLRGLVSHPDEHLRLRVLAALSRQRRELSRRPSSLSRIEELATRELEDGYTRMAAWTKASKRYEHPLLADLMEFRDARTVRRILRVLELRYDRATLKLVRSGIERPHRRANAIEVLDTILEARLRPLILPLLDDTSQEEKVRRAGALVTKALEPEAFLLSECDDPNPYIVAVSLAALAEHPSDAVVARARSALAHAEPMAREAAADALVRMVPERAASWIEALAHDPDPMVAGRAQQLLSPPTDEEAKMHTTVEKVLILKGAHMFSRVPAEDLAPLARVAEEVRFEKGEVICSEGHLGDELYLVLSGKVDVTRGDKTLASFGAGEAFGEMSVLDAEPRSATVTATEPTEVLAIGSEEFYEILHEQVEIAEGVIRMLSARLREANAKHDATGIGSLSLPPSGGAS